MKRILLYRKQNEVLRLNSLIERLKSDSNLFMIISMFLCGNVAGTILLFISHRSFIALKNIILLEYDSSTLFVISFIFLCILTSVILISALCCIGSPFILLTCDILGILCGIISTFCIIEYSYKGILFYIISFFPAILFILLYITTYSNIALDLSLQTARTIFFGDLRKIKTKPLIYLVIMIMPCSAVLSLTVIAGKWIFQQLIQ